MVLLRTLIEKKVLTARSSITDVVDELVAEAANESPPLTIDLLGFESISPSVVDQLLASVAEPLGREVEVPLVLANVPAELSRKYQAVASAHGGSWVQEGRAWAFKRAR